MQAVVASPFTAWGNFYVIIGTAAATLTGLMFVVITLNAGLQNRQPSEGIAAFGTPNVVHFSVAIAIAALLSAPWPTLWIVGLLLSFIGIGGLAYIAMVMRRFTRQSIYQPVMEDWLWHVLLPLVGYIALVVAAIMLASRPLPSLFIIGGVTVLLLFIGIHNAWDTVTYMIINQRQPQQEHQD